MVCICGIEGPHDVADHAEQMFAARRRTPDYLAMTEEERARYNRQCDVVREHLLARLGRSPQRDFGVAKSGVPLTFYIPRVP